MLKPIVFDESSCEWRIIYIYFFIVETCGNNFYFLSIVCKTRSKYRFRRNVDSRRTKKHDAPLSSCWTAQVVTPPGHEPFALSSTMTFVAKMVDDGTDRVRCYIIVKIKMRFFKLGIYTICFSNGNGTNLYYAVNAGFSFVWYTPCTNKCMFLLLILRN